MNIHRTIASDTNILPRFLIYSPWFSYVNQEQQIKTVKINTKVNNNFDTYNSVGYEFITVSCYVCDMNELTMVWWYSKFKSLDSQNNLLCHGASFIPLHITESSNINSYGTG